MAVVDMISSGAVMSLTAAERRGAPVAYVTGLRMRRGAQLYEGTAKTDAKDAWIPADYARRNLDRLRRWRQLISNRSAFPRFRRGWGSALVREIGGVEKPGRTGTIPASFSACLIRLTG